MISDEQKKASSYIVVSYYTLGNQYETTVERLRASLEKFNVPHHLVAIESKGNWYRNTQYKPMFLMEMMALFPDQNLVWVDADAEFFAYPRLFDTMTCNLAAHLLDHKRFSGRNCRPELLSGTLFISNCACMRRMLQDWINVCSCNPRIWDQQALHQVIGDEFTALPAEYCMIFDYMDSIQNPIIKHYQASREQRRLERHR